MSKPNRITLICDIVSSEYCEVVWAADDEDEDIPLGLKMMNPTGRTGSVYLSKEKARELFNWLGVMLIKGPSE